jgi:hypothetical protein
MLQNSMTKYFRRSNNNWKLEWTSLPFPTSPMSFLHPYSSLKPSFPFLFKFQPSHIPWPSGTRQPATALLRNFQLIERTVKYYFI